MAKAKSTHLSDNSCCVELGQRLVKLDDVSTGYHQNNQTLKSISFEGCAGQRIAILGPNGAGKTTLFRLLTNELAAQAGSVEISGKISIVPQTDTSRHDLPISAFDVVMMGTIGRRAWWKRPTKHDHERAESALKIVNLEHQKNLRFGELSGGQRQRVLIARSLTQDANVLILDEPHNGLDSANQQILNQVIEGLASEGHLILVATHDLELAAKYEKALCINREQIAFGAPTEIFDQQIMQATFGSQTKRLDADYLASLCDHHHKDV